jgi:hypothetical protein
LISVVVDVDDTLIDKKRSTHGIWEMVLEREIPFEDVVELRAEEIFERHAAEKQKARMAELRRSFMDIQLCRDERGIPLLRLDEPVPHAAEVLREWSGNCRIVYLTGRIEALRGPTMEQLYRHGFPIEGTELVMFKPEDWVGSSPGRGILGARSRLFSHICDEHDVVRVVDDFPGYFNTYREHDVPELIGLLRSKNFRVQDFLERGATRVVESWEELRGDPPRPRAQ